METQEMVEQFALDMDAKIDGTRFQDDVYVAPVALIRLLGKPRKSDGYKVSGEYRFVDRETGDAVDLYDWKQTTLYSKAWGVSPEELWASIGPLAFHIGARSSDVAVRFKRWLLSVV